MDFISIAKELQRFVYAAMIIVTVLYEVKAVMTEEPILHPLLLAVWIMVLLIQKFLNLVIEQYKTLYH